MSDATTIVRTYIEMWNETEPERRRELVARALTDDASYLDPIMAGNGVQEISDMIGAAQEQYPGHRFALVSGPTCTTTACGSHGRSGRPPASRSPSGWTSRGRRTTGGCGSNRVPRAGRLGRAGRSRRGSGSGAAAVRGR